MKKDNNIKISVITISYNCADDLERTIKSVVDQDYGNLEYIIVDGGSKDRTASVVKRYSHLITKWISEPDRGVYDAMNKGIHMATGQWLNFMNAGDTFHNDKVISSFVRNIENKSNIVVAYGNTVGCNNGRKMKDLITYPLSTISYRTPFCHQSTFIKNLGKEIFYNEKYSIVADYDLFYRLFFKYGDNHFMKLNFIVADYDISGGLSKSPNYKYEQQRERLNIRAEHKDFRWLYETLKYFVKVLFLKAPL